MKQHKSPSDKEYLNFFFIKRSKHLRHINADKLNNVRQKKYQDMFRGLQGFKKGYEQRTWLPIIRVLGLTIPTIFWNRRGITSVRLL